MTVHLREVTKQTLRQVLLLKVAPEQERLVASNAVSIAQAYFDRDKAWFRAIHDGDAPVGFVMLDTSAPRGQYFLWRLMIDREHQRRGLGSEAMRLVIDHVRAQPGATALLLSHEPGPGNPGPFYEKLGFSYTGEADPDGELIMRMEL